METTTTQKANWTCRICSLTNEGRVSVCRCCWQNATHCVAGQNCAIAYGTPESLGIAADFAENDDGSVSGPVALVATFWLAHGFDITKFDVVGG